MALTNKKLSSYNNLQSNDVNATTKLVSISGTIPENKNIPLNEFVVDSLTSTSSIKPLSAKQGGILKNLIDNIEVGPNENIFNTDLHVIETTGFNSGQLWVNSYRFLLIPGSYGVYFTTPPIPQLLPSKQNFTLSVEYASAKNTGMNSNTDYVHRLTDVSTGKEFIRKVYYTSSGIVCSPFSQVQSGENTTTITGQNGKDGTDTEFIYIMKNSEAALPIPENALTDNYIPVGWSSTLNSVSPSAKFGFMSKRKKVNGVWSAFSAPVIVSNYSINGTNGTNGINGTPGDRGDDGIDGTDIEFIFKTTTTYSAPSTPSTSQIPDYVPSEWTDNMSGVNITNQYEWVCKRTKSTDGTWSNFTTPALWAKWSVDGGGQGEPGVNGIDGKDIEFIFTRTTILVQPQTPNSVNVEDYIPANWTGSMVGVDITNKYEWVSKRYKAGATWQSFSAPVVWAIFSENGADGTNGNPGDDGKGIEFIFKTTTEKVVPTPTPNSTMTSGNNPAKTYQEDDWFPIGWTDNITGTDPVNKYEWACKRIKRVVNGVSTWSSFSTPVLWANWSAGTPGVNAASVVLSTNIINLSCLATGDPRTGTLPRDTFIYAYDGINPANITGIDLVVNEGLCEISPATIVSPGKYKFTLLSIPTEIDYVEITVSVTMLIASTGTSITINKTLFIIKIKDGYAGPKIIARGSYTSDTDYFGNADRVDVVSVTINGASNWYVAKPTTGTIRNIKPYDTPGWTAYWDTMPSFEMIATGTLFAENANVAELIFNGGKLYSQYGINPLDNSLTLNGPLENKNIIINGVTGELTANNAKIRGEINATSGKIGNIDIAGDTLTNGAIRIDNAPIPSLAFLKTAKTTIIPISPQPNSPKVKVSPLFRISEFSDLSFTVYSSGQGSGIYSHIWEIRKLKGDESDPGDYDVVAGIPQSANELDTYNVELGIGLYLLRVEEPSGDPNGYIELSDVSYSYKGYTSQTVLCQNGFYNILNPTRYMYYNGGLFEVRMGESILTFTEGFGLGISLDGGANTRYL